MKPGPKPMPDNVRAIRGNPGKRGPKPDSSSATAGGAKNQSVLLRAPRGLSKDEQKLWRRLAKQFHILNTTTELDEMAMRLLVDTYSRYEQANTALRQHGLIVKVGQQGHVQQSPYLQVANKAQEQLVRLLSEFGMTPSSRTRVDHVEGDMGGDDGGQIGLLD